MFPSRASVKCARCPASLNVFFANIQEVPMSHQTVTLDVDEAVQRFNGNRQIFTRLLLRFLELNSSVDAKLEQALARGDRDELAMFFHSLKGGSANLSAKRLAEKCSDLEKLAKAGDIDTVKAELPSFLELFGELKAAVEDLRAV
jgi:HPt (histidine-containing phosphotransfer) domain-containing protein